MSTKKPRHYRLPDGELRLMPRPWWIDVGALGLVTLWMLLTFATIQQYGPRPSLILGAVVIASVMILPVYGQRLEYLRIGDKLEIDMRTETQRHNDEQQQEEREKYR